MFLKSKYLGFWLAALLPVSAIFSDNVEKIEELSFEHAPIQTLYKKGQATFFVNVPNASLIQDIVVFYQLTKTKDEELVESNLDTIVLKQTGTRFKGYLKTGDGKESHFAYFLRFQLRDGKNLIYPKPAAQDQLRFLRGEIKEDKVVPVVRLLKPEDKKAMSGKDFVLQYVLLDKESGIDPARTKFFLNDVDFTPATTVNSNIVEFKPDKALTEGTYSHFIETADFAGNTVKSEVKTFVIKSEKELQEEDKKWQGEGNFAYTYDSNLELNGDRDWNLQQLRDNATRTFTIQYTATKDDTKIDLGPAIITDAESTPGNRNDKISFGITKGNLETKWGDISSDISTYTISTANSGAYVAYKTDKEPTTGTVEYRVTGGETQQGYSTTTENGTGKFSRNSFGSMVGYNIRRDLKIYTAYQLSEDQQDSIQDAEGVEAYRNQSAEAGGEIAVDDWNTKFTGKYGVSHTERLRLIRGEQGGYSMGLGANNTLKKIDLTSNLTYDQTSPNFIVFPGSGGSPDQRRIALQNATNFFKGILGLNFGNDFSHDNLLEEKPETTYNYTTTNGFNLNFPKMPTFNYTNSIIWRESTGAGEVKTKTQTLTNNAGTSYSYELFKKNQNQNVNFSHSYLDDESLPNPSDDTITLGLTYAYQIDIIKWLNFGFNYGLNDSENQTTFVSSVTYTHGISFNTKHFKDAWQNTITINKSQSFEVSKAGNEKLTSTSYSFNLTSQYNITEKINSSLNLGYSISPEVDEIDFYPGSFTFSFQFNMIF